MIGTLLWSLTRFGVPLSVFLFCPIGALNGQSGDTAVPTSGRIMRIEPQERKGALKVKQGKRLAPINAVEGMLIRRGYILILNPQAKATVVCGDGKKRELAPGPQGCPCTRPCTPEVCGIHYDGSTIGATRGPDTDKGTFPVVVSPRKTMLLNLRPTIRWAPIAGAKESDTYRVTLYGDGMNVIWTKEVASATDLTYPDKEPSLTPGRTYKVVVTSNGLSSEQDHSPGLGFTTLPVDQARALADEEIKKKELGLPAPQTRFLICSLFAARELYSEAIEQAQDIFAITKQPAVAMMLGDLFATIGLNREAEKEYLKALSLTQSDDLETVGLTTRSLAAVYENLGMYDRAIARLKEARKAYQRLRNKAIVNALLRDERRLARPRGRR